MERGESLWYQLLGYWTGYPLLLLIFYAIILRLIWKNEQDNRTQKFRWTAILLVPALLALGLWILLQQMFLPSINARGVLSIITVLLPLVGILVWLIRTR